MKLYQMSEEELQEIKDASKSVPYIVVGGQLPTSPQENANRAWQALAEKKGFIWDTVVPAQEKGQDFFYAEEK